MSDKNRSCDSQIEITLQKVGDYKVPEKKGSLINNIARRIEKF